MKLLLLLLLFAVPAVAQNCPPGATPSPASCPPGSCGCCGGDADKNGFINSTDFATIILHFGETLPTNGLGDADCNGYVNYADYGAVQRSFGKACP